MKRAGWIGAGLVGVVVVGIWGTRLLQKKRPSQWESPKTIVRVPQKPKPEMDRWVDEVQSRVEAEIKDLMPQHRISSTYQKNRDQYLESPMEFSRQSENAATLARGLAQELSQAGLKKTTQATVLSSLGRYYYNESFVVSEPNAGRELKVRLLRLAIAHLEEARKI